MPKIFRYPPLPSACLPRRRLPRIHQLTGKDFAPERVSLTLTTVLCHPALGRISCASARLIVAMETAKLPPSFDTRRAMRLRRDRSIGYAAGKVRDPRSGWQTMCTDRPRSALPAFPLTLRPLHPLYRGLLGYVRGELIFLAAGRYVARIGNEARNFSTLERTRAIEFVGEFEGRAAPTSSLLAHACR